ncbi:MAG: polymer-forming cytoskeletal protein [Rhodospirillaceae bacterium]
MFSNKVNGQSQEQVAITTEAPVKSVPSIISVVLSVEGNLSSNGEIQVDGTVLGDVSCKALIVGIKGSVCGEVTAQTVRIHGAINGQVKAKSVFLASTAQMSGDIEHESLAIEPGAYIEGHCKRIPTEVPKRLATATNQEPVSAKVRGKISKLDKDILPQAAASV